MHKKILIVLFCVSSSLFSQTKTALSKTILPSIEEILQQPEDSINIGVACLSLAKEFYPTLKHDFFLYAFDYLANRYKHYFGGYTKPDDKIGALNTFIYRKGYWNDSITFDYDRDDLKGKNIDNYYINCYIARKKGNCLTMPMLYLILAERLDIPLYAVRAPNHFFVRYVPKNKPKDVSGNIEATSGGGNASNEMYIKDMQIPKKGIQTGMYLRTLTKKEYIASIMLFNVNQYIERKQFDKAQHYAEIAMQYDSTLVTARWYYGLVHYKRGWYLKEQMQAEIQSEIETSKIIAQNRANMPQSQTSYDPMLSFPNPTNNSQKEYYIGNTKIVNGRPQISYYSVPTPPHNIFGEFGTGILQEPDIQQRQQVITPELQNDIEAIRERYLPIIEKNLEVWYTLKEKAKDMGMATGLQTQTSFFKKQTKKLQQFKSEGDK